MTETPNDPRPLVEQAESILELAFAVATENPVYRSQQQKELIDAAQKLHAALAAEPAPVGTREPDAWRWRFRTQPDKPGHWSIGFRRPQLTDDEAVIEPLFTSPSRKP